MKLAYNSNGWRGHSIETIVEALSRLGYDAIELSPQRDQLAPESWTQAEAERISRIVANAGLQISNLHAGAHDLLKHDAPHEPSLMSISATERAHRLDLNRRAIDFAAALGTDLVCVTSGRLPNQASVDGSWQRLVDGIADCLAHAATHNIRIAVEPEPELFIRSCVDFLALYRQLGCPPGLGLNLDIGHAQVIYEDTPAIIREFAPLLWHVHVEDIAGRAHKHLIPGQGQIDFHGIGKALTDIGYIGAASVELMDHSAQAENVARHCMAVLQSWRRSVGAA
jgi:sugar phosphate isomerase/epimerase